ncbi:Helix-turn-helix domain-containing protein [Paenibacillus algorifonticola]|uniref:Helix-turn-helix domain-containing protein n=1 Tax=Paenibacillus algorifonticola TaxID=684063 RepID=A0A1I2FLP0_9BACL|nr:AraC family transcriptional regulator [Paenibacillus algorifonticola]SFF05688.1 Helix-turn-helix domain-containing protein [Paenibacillus algorifonticola]
MTFQQLATIMPYPEQVTLHHSSQQLNCPSGHHAIIVVRRGHITLTSANNSSPIICSQGFACHPQFSPYSIEVPKTKEAEYAIIEYRALPEDSSWLLEGLLTTYSEVKIHYMVDELLRGENQTNGLLSQDAEQTAEQAAAQRVRERMMLERILYIFLRETLMKEADQSTIRSITESISYINEHYMLPLSLPMLAKRAGMSEGHYTVLFKKETGRTMTSYLRSLRIEKAKLLLLQVKLPAKEVAQKVGFADYFYFSRMFKQEVGCSPTLFKKQAMNEK